MGRISLMIISLLALGTCSTVAYEDDPEIAASLAEGERLIAEYEALMSGSELSESNKSELENEVENLKDENSGPPDHLLGVSYIVSEGAGSWSGSSSSSSSGTGGSCTKTCCKFIIPPLIKQRQYTSTWSCWHYYTSNGSTSCGLFGWSRCSTYSTQGRYSTCYLQNISYYSETQSCPSDRLTCCKGHFWYKDCCMNVSRLRQILEKAKSEGK